MTTCCWISKGSRNAAALRSRLLITLKGGTQTGKKLSVKIWIFYNKQCLGQGSSQQGPTAYHDTVSSWGRGMHSDLNSQSFML